MRRVFLRDQTAGKITPPITRAMRQPARFPLVAGSAEELAAAIDADQPGEAGA